MINLPERTSFNSGDASSEDDQASRAHSLWLRDVLNNKEKFLRENGERLQVKYASVRRQNFEALNKGYSAEKISHKIVTEWNRLTPLQKISFQLYLDGRLKTAEVTDGFKVGKKERIRNQNFESKHGIQLEELKEEGLVEPTAEKYKNDIFNLLKLSKLREGPSIDEICKGMKISKKKEDPTAAADAETKKSRAEAAKKKYEERLAAEREKERQRQNIQAALEKEEKASKFSIKFNYRAFEHNNPSFKLELDGYVFFAQKQRHMILLKNPEASIGEILREIRHQWQFKIPSTEKAYYEDKARIIREHGLKQKLKR